MDAEFRSRRQFSVLRGRVGASSETKGNFLLAVRFRLAGWPAYDVLRETDGPRHQGLEPKHTCAREFRMGPLSVALAFAGATTAPQREFGMMDDNGDT